MNTQYIGPKKIKSVETSEEKTVGGNDITKVIYEDGTIEFISSMMFDKVVSEETSDESVLRDKRMTPVVELVLSILRDWGVKVGELPYFSALLNRSLEYNSNQALLKLVGEYMPKPNSLDDIDYITVDRILRNNKDGTK